MTFWNLYYKSPREQPYGTEILCLLLVSCSIITHHFWSLTLFVCRTSLFKTLDYCVSCAWKNSGRTEAEWCWSFHKQQGEIPPPHWTGLPFNLKQDRTSECDHLREWGPQERYMANVLVERHLLLELHEIFPENTHIWLSFNSTFNHRQVFLRLK